MLLTPPCPPTVADWSPNKVLSQSTWDRFIWSGRFWNRGFLWWAVHRIARGGSGVHRRRAEAGEDLQARVLLIPVGPHSCSVPSTAGLGVGGGEPPPPRARGSHAARSRGPQPAQSQCQTVTPQWVTTILPSPRGRFSCSHLDPGDRPAHLGSRGAGVSGVIPRWGRCTGLCGAGGVETGPSSSSHLGPHGLRSGDSFKPQTSRTPDGRLLLPAWGGVSCSAGP